MQIRGFQQKLAERIVTQAVEPRGDQDEARREIVERGVQLALEELAELPSRGAGGERNVPRGTHTIARTSLLPRARSRIPRILMKGHEVDGRVVVKDVLRAVAV